MPYLVAFLTFVFSIVPSGKFAPADPNTIGMYTYTGTPALIAHENLAGASFSNLMIGDYVTITYPEYSKVLEVTDIQRYDMIYWNMDAPAEWVNFISQDDKKITAYQLYDTVYNSGHAFILQTCYNGGKGRLFVILDYVHPSHRLEDK
jgi:hypothetical protein